MKEKEKEGERKGERETETDYIDPLPQKTFARIWDHAHTGESFVSEERS